MQLLRTMGGFRTRLCGRSVCEKSLLLADANPRTVSVAHDLSVLFISDIWDGSPRNDVVFGAMDRLVAALAAPGVVWRTNALTVCLCFAQVTAECPRFSWWHQQAVLGGLPSSYAAHPRCDRPARHTMRCLCAGAITLLQ